MNHSFYSVDRTTHLKVVTVALIGAIAVAGISIAAHTGGSNGIAQGGHVRVVKAGQPVMVTSNIQLAVQ
ncbi:hypothetical protein KMZ29_06900 [Bradyrhizobium sediminis]|uniref:Uncharacterized protein n=1 Tax=Bradyrhizobium sediminis TaxID=2840469 RepID=A0A975NH72_9BRAD|nr:hypothetical protein [Bradyrhizobium sediminis]QWG14394.1 hypothetical protein KMZ29_06900 [Bradyrhizobium sediminis]